ncbi:MAG: hypothetical protein JWM59_1620 [Verrucomicrobiales bacterium]|nr:hypothetical protein [Verrucomicrobiales bacterium]
MKTAFVLISATALVASALPSQAALVHLYTFKDGTASDSVGTSNGVILNSANAVFSNGVLNISDNDGGGPANNAYVDLPNVFSPPPSTEAPPAQPPFPCGSRLPRTATGQPALAFGTSNNGENTSDGGNAAD